MTTFADKLVAILNILIHVSPFFYVVALIVVVVLYRKWSPIPIFLSCMFGVAGIILTIKPGGWGFQYLAAPWVFALWGSICLLIAIVVHFRTANELAPFYVSLSLTTVLLAAVLAGMFAARTIYDDDRRFWRDAVASDSYKLDQALYQRHLSKAGKDEIERLKYDNCRKMSKEFVSLLFDLKLNVESCTNAADDVMRFYQQKHMVRDEGGALNYSFKQKDARILARDKIALDLEYKKMDFEGVANLCADVVRHNRIKTNNVIKLSQDVVEHEIDKLSKDAYDEVQMRRQLGQHLPEYLEMLATSATSGAQISAIYVFIQDLGRKYGKDVLGWRYQIPLGAIIENANTRDDLFYPLLDRFIAERKFGYVSDVIAHSNRLEKNRLLNYARHNNAEVRVAALTNHRLAEDEIYVLLSDEQKEEVILAGLANIAARNVYNLERLIGRFEKIKWRMGDGERSSPPPVLAALIRAGYDESWIYYNYLNDSSDRTEVVNFVTSLDSTKKIRFIDGKYGSPFLDGHQYLLNYLENDPDPNVARRAKDAKATRYRLE